MRLQTRPVLWFVTAICLGMAVPLAAQSRQAPRRPRPAPEFRGFVAVSVPFQFATADFDTRRPLLDNAEPGELRMHYAGAGGMAFDVSGGALLWRQIGVRAGFNRSSHTVPTTVTASVAHPFFFQRPRTVTAELDGISRAESSFDVDVMAVLSHGRRLQAMVFGGPSFIRVSHDLVTSVPFVETYPYDAVQLGRVESSTAAESSVGYNVGADVAYFLTRQLGVGLMLKLTHGTASVPQIDGGIGSLSVGGAQVGAGVRFRF